MGEWDLRFSWLIISTKSAPQALEEDEHPGRETLRQLRKGFVPPAAVAAGVFVIPQHGEMMSGGHEIVTRGVNHPGPAKGHPVGQRIEEVADADVRVGADAAGCQRELEVGHNELALGGVLGELNQPINAVTGQSNVFEAQLMPLREAQLVCERERRVSLSCGE